MSLKEYFDDGREAQRKHSQKQSIRKQYPPIRLKPKKLEFCDPRLVIRGLGVVYEMLSPLISKLSISNPNTKREPKKPSKPAIPAMIAVMKKDIDSLLVWLHLKKPKAGYGSYREFLDLAERKNE